jgi:hypothetical protein
MSAAFDRAQALYDAAEPDEATTPDCYHCSQPIEGTPIWDTEPGDPAYHPACYATVARADD